MASILLPSGKVPWIRVPSPRRIGLLVTSVSPAPCNASGSVTGCCWLLCAGAAGAAGVSCCASTGAAASMANTAPSAIGEVKVLLMFQVPLFVILDAGPRPWQIGNSPARTNETPITHLAFVWNCRHR